MYDPPALQLPAEAHDTELIGASPVLRAAVPGTLTAVCQMPFTSLTTNAWMLKELVVAPADAAVARRGARHRADLRGGPRMPVRRARAMPGTLMAVRQVPFTSLTTND